MQGRIHGGGARRIGKNMIFLRKIVIFFHEIPQQFSRLPPLGAIFLSVPPNLKSWIPPCNVPGKSIYMKKNTHWCYGNKSVHFLYKQYQQERSTSTRQHTVWD
jgi:hypothetical protein